MSEDVTAAGMRPPAATDAEFETLRAAVLKDVRYAMDAFFSYIAIHQRAAADQAVYRAINSHARHWIVTLASLQAGFFIAMGRIFDVNDNARSIHLLANLVMRSADLFTREALARRKAGFPGYADDKWHPSTAELRGTFKKPITRWEAWHEQVLRPIRGQVFAHAIADEALTTELFSKAQIADIEAAMFFIFALVDDLWHLHMNGRRPEESNARAEFDRLKSRAEAEAAAVLEALKSRRIDG